MHIAILVATSQIAITHLELVKLTCEHVLPT